jgi:Dolichyl-phosphate-mannose-protein mannosyltransferase
VAIETTTRRPNRLLAPAVLGVAALTALAFALRVRGMGEGLYGDELISFAEIHNRSLSGMLDAVANGAGPGAPVENTPPLWFLLAWFSVKLGDPTSWIRLPSVVLGTATVPVVYLLGRQTLGQRAALVGAAFVALSPFAIWYGIDARAYGALMFFAALSTLALLGAVRTGRPAWWVGYGAAVAAVLYTHYTGVIPVAVQAAWTLWFRRGRWRALVLAYGGVVLAYVAWLPHINSSPANFAQLAALRGITDWDSLLQWLAGSQELAIEDMPGVPALILIGSGLLVGVAGTIRAWRRPDAIQLLIVLLAVATPVALLLYGVVGDDLFVFPRNLSASFPFAALVVGWLVTPSNRVIAAAATALVGVGLCIGTVKTLQARFHRPDYPEVADLLDARAGSDDLVVYYGAGFSPFILKDVLPVYYRRDHRIGLADVRQGSVERAVARGARPDRLFIAELRQGGVTPPPLAPGWEQVDRRVFEGFFPLVVTVARRLGPGDYVLSGRSIRERDGTSVPVRPGAGRGFVDSAAMSGGTVTVTGWAGSSDHRPVDRIVAFAGGRLVAAGLPTLARPDVGKMWGVSGDDLGFALELPARLATGRLEVFGIAGDGAMRMSVDCTTYRHRAAGQGLCSG